MRRMNLYFGLLLFLVFLGTGLYLKFIFKPENLMNLPARMEIRANHIYILFIALLNIFSYGVRPKVAESAAATTVNAMRGFLMVAGIFSVVAFFTEHSGTLTERRFTFYSIVLSITATVSYLVVLYRERKIPER